VPGGGFPPCCPGLSRVWLRMKDKKAWQIAGGSKKALVASVLALLRGPMRAPLGQVPLVGPDFWGEQVTNRNWIVAIKPTRGGSRRYSKPGMSQHAVRLHTSPKDRGLVLCLLKRRTTCKSSNTALNSNSEIVRPSLQKQPSASSQPVSFPIHFNPNLMTGSRKSFNYCWCSPLSDGPK